QMDALLDMVSLAGLPSENPASRQRCWRELRSARQAGFVALENLDLRTLVSGAYLGNGNSSAVDGDKDAERILVETADGLVQSGYPVLARLMGLRLPWDEPFVLEMVEYFLQRILKQHQTLAHELADEGHHAATRWRCLELVARLLGERAEEI